MIGVIIMNNELWLIWKDLKNRSRHKIGMLRKYDDRYVFEYFKNLEEEKKLGFEYFPGFDDLNRVYESKNLFPNIETRLPNVNRPDYLEILNSYNLSRESSKFDILRVTKGRLITDTYEFVPAFDKTKIEFDVAGTRHCKDLKICKNYLEINDNLYLELESNNEYDENAVKVLYKKHNIIYHIGYVPKFYSKELTELLKTNISYSAMIQSLNINSRITDEEISALVKLIFD